MTDNDTTKIIMDREIEKKIAREVKRRVAETKDFEPHDAISSQKPEDSFERGVGGISKAVLAWAAGIVLTSIISLNVYLVNSVSDLNTRVTVIEKNFEVLNEIKEGTKDIKSDTTKLTIDVEKIKMKIGGF
jgi:hypothetical protein